MTCCQSRSTCRDILKKNWKITITNTTDNAAIIQSQAPDTRYRQMHEVNMYVYRCLCVYVSLCVCVCMYIHTYVRTYVRTYIHTYIHTYYRATT